MSTATVRRSVTIGPLTLYRDHSLHSITGQPYVSAVGYRLGGRYMPGLLYIMTGLLVAWAIGMSMVNPLTWLAVLLWPLVLVLELFALLFKAAAFILSMLLVVGITLWVGESYRNMGRRMRSLMSRLNPLR